MHATLLQIDYLRSQITHSSIFADAVKKGPLPEVVKMIQDQLKDNRVMVVEIVGERMVTLIDKL